MRTGPPSPRQPVRAGSASRHVATTREKSPGTTPAPRACRTNARHNTFNRLQRCHERREEVIDAFFDLADTSSTVRGLIRQGFLPPGLKGGGQLVAHPLRGMGARAAHPETWWPSRCPARISGGDLLPLAGRELDPTVAPMAWKMAFSRSPLPRGSVEGT
jgi:hypothetical protein